MKSHALRGKAVVKVLQIFRFYGRFLRRKIDTFLWLLIRGMVGDFTACAPIWKFTIAAQILLETHA